MTVSAVSAAATTTTAVAADATKASADYTNFLKLLVAELKNQDPMKPLDPTQSVTQLEHLAIYARPASHAPGAGPMRPSLIDTAPVGSMRRSGASLAGYEILQATAESVLLRLPEGRVTRVMQGSRVAGLGGVLAIEQDGRLWSVVTQAGVIRQIDHR